MSWTTPTNPVAGTVITVAYAVTNFVNNLLWLRGLTGSADPPGSNYTIRSTSTTATDWSKITEDMVTPSTLTGNAAGSAIGSNSININRINASLTAGEFARITGSAAVVATANIIDDAVTEPKMANDSVGTNQLIASNVTLAKMASNSVGNAQIVAGAVTYDKTTGLAPLSSIQGPPLVLTTSNGDLAQITAAVAGLYIVHAHVVLYTTTTAGDTGQNLQAWIAAPSGTVGTLFRHFTGATAVDQNAVQAQTTLIQLTVGQQVTLRAKKSGGTGNSGANDGTLIAVRLSA